VNDVKTLETVSQSDQVAIQIWLETAPVDQIRATRSLSSDAVKSDIDAAIRSLMDSDRPGLALDFPQLLNGRIFLRDLARSHAEFADALNHRHLTSHPITKQPMGTGKALAILRKLESAGSINSAQRTLLIEELNHYVATQLKPQSI
jgi:hypothetical protein